MSLIDMIRPAALWTHAMFAVLSKSEKSSASRIDLTRDSHAHLLGESQAVAAQYVQLARRAMAAGSAFHSRPNRWGNRSILHWLGRRRQPWLWLIPRGGDFSARVDIDSKEFGARQPEALRHAQVLSNVDNQSVVGVFKTRRAKDPRDTCAVGTISGGLRILLDAEWILTASNDIADPILPRL